MEKPIDKAKYIGYNKFAKSNSGGEKMLSNETKSAIAEMVALLEPLSEEDKRQALALIKGMIIGKELAEQQKTA